MQVETVTTIEQKLSELKSQLHEDFNVSNIGYFGSFARNEPSSDSDIDILVEFYKPLGWEFFDLKDFLEAQLGRKVDLVSKSALKRQLREKILKEVKYID